MPRIKPVSWKILVKIFERWGCKYLRKKGSHHILKCPGAKRVVVIPEYEKVIRSSRFSRIFMVNPLYPFYFLIFG